MPRALELPTAASRLARAGVLGRDIARLRFVNDAREEVLRRLHVGTVGDLLLRIPRRYLDFTRAYAIEQAPLGQVATIIGTVDKVVEKHPRPRMVVTQVFLVDATGVLQVAFFRQPWLSKQIQKGDRLAVMGKVEFAYGFKQMASPHFEKLDEGTFTGSILPVHPATEGLSAAWMRRLVSVALEDVDAFPDPLPARLRSRRALMPLSRALRCIHFPRALAEVPLARRRLAYDEVSTCSSPSVCGTMPTCSTWLPWPMWRASTWRPCGTRCRSRSRTSRRRLPGTSLPIWRTART